MGVISFSADLVSFVKKQQQRFRFSSVRYFNNIGQVRVMSLQRRPQIVILVVLVLSCSVYSQEPQKDDVAGQSVSNTSPDNSSDSVANNHSTTNNETEDLPPTTQEILATTEPVSTDEGTTQAMTEVMTTKVPLITEPPPTTTSPTQVDTTIPPTEER